jgi:actin-like ATPase involved in cell morphogenesis
MKGLLGKQILTADQETSLVQIGTNVKYAEVDINILNPTANDATISLAFSQQAVTPLAADYVEQGLILTNGGSVLIRSKEILSPGERVYVKSNVAGVVVRVTGIEQVN